MSSLFAGTLKGITTPSQGVPGNNSNWFHTPIRDLIVGCSLSSYPEIVYEPSNMLQTSMIDLGGMSKFEDYQQLQHLPK